MSSSSASSTSSSASSATSASSSLRQLLWTGRLEAVSMLVLVGIAMPLKYGFDSPGAVRVVGMIHGVLFLAYALALYRAASEHRWPWKWAAVGLAASLFPFGPFWFERYLRERQP